MGKLLLLVLGLSACHTVVTGDDTATDYTLATAHTLYQSTVYPIIVVCQSCHYPGAENGTLDYDSITTTPLLDGYLGTAKFDPALSQLLTKGAHQGAPGLKAEDAYAIIAWLEAEEEARY